MLGLVVLLLASVVSVKSLRLHNDMLLKTFLAITITGSVAMNTNAEIMIDESSVPTIFEAFVDSSKLDFLTKASQSDKTTSKPQSSRKIDMRKLMYLMKIYDIQSNQFVAGAKVPYNDAGTLLYYC
jgi:hypothetical protein